MTEAYPLNQRSEFRFWSKVQKAGVNECWLWLAGFFPNGYGAFSVGSWQVNSWEHQKP
jgi:hypothetical protein